MKAIITHVTTRASGKVVKRDETVNAESLRFGRSADCEAFLDDNRVKLHHATLHLREKGLFVEAEGRQGISVNGSSSMSASVRDGDVIGIGPYDVVVHRNDAGDADLRLEIQLVRPAPEGEADVKARSKLSLRDSALSKRGLSWVAFLAAAVFCLALPLFAYYGGHLGKPVENLNGVRGMEAKADRPDRFWNTGDLSAPHKFLSDQCNSCHLEAFEMSPDSACASCHESVQHHMDPVKFPNSEIASAMCQSCHKEHNGGAAPIFRDQSLCGDCHENLHEKVPNTDLLNASDFGKDHGDFRPAVVVDEAGTIARVPFDQLASTKEMSNLKFPHDKHLSDKGVRGPEKVEFLGCQDCHTSEPGGQGLRPISQPDHCQRCHTMAFDAQQPDRALHHGDVADILHVLDEFYADMALRKGFKEGAVEPVLPPQVNTRRRAGAPAMPVIEARQIARAPVDSDKALEWAKKKSSAARESVFGKQVCGACHEVLRPEESATGDWDIKPVKLVDRWLHKGIFDHSRHESLNCGSCHQAKTSKEATDILLPGIANCRDCHGGGEDELKVPSTCVDCHDLHIESLPPLRKTKEQSVQLPDGHPPQGAG